MDVVDNRASTSPPWLARAKQSIRAGDLDAAIRVLDAAEDEASRDGRHADRVSAVARRGQVHARAGRWGRAMADMEHAVLLADRHHVSPSTAPYDRALVAFRIGQHAHCLTLCDEALRRYSRPEDQGLAVQTIALRGQASRSRGDRAAAIADLERVLALAPSTRGLAVPGAVRSAWMGLVEAHVDAGDLDAAERALEGLEAAMREGFDDPFEQAHLAWSRAHVRLARGDPGARADAEVCLAASDREGLTWERHAALRLVARAAAAEGDVQAAWEHEREAADLAEKLFAVRLETTMELQRARHDAEVEHLRSVELAEANRELSEVLDTLQERTAALGRARDQAEASAGALQRLLRVVSEELRPAVDGIVGAVELLGGTPMSSGQRELIEVVRRAAGVLLDHVGALHETAQLEAGTLQLEPSVVDVGPLVERVSRVLRPVFRRHGARLQVALEAGVPDRVRADRRRLEEVLEHLLTHAAEHAAGDTVLLTVRGDGDDLVARVDDPGPPLADDEFERVFEPFARVRGEIGSVGVGLRLCIAERLVRLAGGSCEAGRSVRGGLALTIRLPDIAEPEASRSSSRQVSCAF